MLMPSRYYAASRGRCLLNNVCGGEGGGRGVCGMWGECVLTHLPEDIVALEYLKCVYSFFFNLMASDFGSDVSNNYVSCPKQAGGGCPPTRPILYDWCCISGF